MIIGPVKVLRCSPDSVLQIAHSCRINLAHYKPITPSFHAYGLNQDQQSKLLIGQLIITSFVLVLEIISIVTFEFECSSTAILRITLRLTRCFCNTCIRIKEVQLKS